MRHPARGRRPLARQPLRAHGRARAADRDLRAELRNRAHRRSREASRRSAKSVWPGGARRSPRSTMASRRARIRRCRPMRRWRQACRSRAAEALTIARARRISKRRPSRAGRRAEAYVEHTAGGVMRLAIAACGGEIARLGGVLCGRRRGRGAMLRPAARGRRFWRRTRARNSADVSVKRTRARGRRRGHRSGAQRACTHLCRAAVFPAIGYVALAPAYLAQHQRPSLLRVSCALVVRLSATGRRVSHASKSPSARSAMARFFARPRSSPLSFLPSAPCVGASIGGNRPKLTFIGWNEPLPASMCPPVTCASSAPSAVVRRRRRGRAPSARPRRSGRRAGPSPRSRHSLQRP